MIKYNTLAKPKFLGGDFRISGDGDLVYRALKGRVFIFGKSKLYNTVLLNRFSALTLVFISYSRHKVAESLRICRKRYRELEKLRATKLGRMLVGGK